MQGCPRNVGELRVSGAVRRGDEHAEPGSSYRGDGGYGFGSAHRIHVELQLEGRRLARTERLQRIGDAIEPVANPPAELSRKANLPARGHASLSQNAEHPR